MSSDATPSSVVPLDYPVNALASFHYFENVDVAELERWGLRTIADSGAYSAVSQGEPVDLVAYAEWLQRWRGHLAWCASLDVIGNARKSFANFRRLVDEYDLQVVPTIHFGAKPSLIDQYAEAGVDFIGLGGMVPYKMRPAHLMRWCLSVFMYARDKHPQMRFHGWGVTHSVLLDSLPWWSVDSSGAGAAYRYGECHLYDPRRHKKHRVYLNGRDLYRYDRLLREHYGLPASEVASSIPENRPQLIRMGAKTYQLREAVLRQKFQVEPPAWGVDKPILGPSIHMVDSTPNNLRHLQRPTKETDNE